MAFSKLITATFFYEEPYHIVFKAIGKLELFRNDDNRKYFLQKFEQYLLPYFEMWAYCLLGNHVHFLVKVKSKAFIEQVFINRLAAGQKLTETQEKYFLHKSIPITNLLEKECNSFMVSYTRSFNNYYNQKGHLFDSPFKRIAILDDMHFTKTIIYIHANPQKHKIVSDFKLYKWSSYGLIEKNVKGLINTESVIKWFGNWAAFEKAHQLE